VGEGRDVNTLAGAGVGKPRQQTVLRIINSQLIK
jgi:hypothetical protein